MRKRSSRGKMVINIIFDPAICTQYNIFYIYIIVEISDDKVPATMHVQSISGLPDSTSTCL